MIVDVQVEGYHWYPTTDPAYCENRKAIISLAAIQQLLITSHGKYYI